jgi:hypothetical protein
MEDPWLDQLVTDLTSEAWSPSEETWNRVISLGLRRRLRQVSAEEAKATLDRLHAGEVEPEPEIEEFRLFTEEEVMRVERRMAACIYLLGCSLDDLWNAIREEREAHHLTVLHLCHNRDELEAVDFLLQQRGRKEYTHLLSGLDVLGQSVMDALPNEVPEIRDDEWLNRASLINPESWWTSLVG